MVLQNLKRKITQQVTLGNSFSEMGTRFTTLADCCLESDGNNCGQQQWLVWTTDQDVLGTLGHSGSWVVPATSSPLGIGRWTAARGRSNHRKLVSATGKTEFHSVISHDNWGNAAHRVHCTGWRIFTAGKPTMESFPKDYTATRVPDHVKEVLHNCSLSSYKWCSVKIILLLHYHHTKIESQGNNHHPKFLSQSTLWS